MKTLKSSALHTINKLLIVMLSLFSIFSFTSCVKYGTNYTDNDFSDEIYNQSDNNTIEIDAFEEDAEETE